MDLRILLPRGSEHATRLRLSSGLAWSNPDELFRRVGLEAGMRCLDVRCGAGQATLSMARRAGAEGLAVGIDPDERLLALARAEAARQGLNAEFRPGDVAELEESAAFDLVYTRFLLSQLRKDGAEEDLKQMARLVRPGGTIVVEDVDYAPGPDAEGVDHPAYNRFRELFHAVMRDEEDEPAAERRLPRLLEQAGVAGVRCTEAPPPSAGDGQARNPAAVVLGSIRNAVVATQLATRLEVDRLVYELNRLRTAPQRPGWLPRIVQIWGVVPNTAGGL